MSKPKSNPFGSATAVDTASKLSALEEKAQKAKEEEQKEAPQESEAAPVDSPEASTTPAPEASKEEDVPTTEESTEPTNEEAKEDAEAPKEDKRDRRSRRLREPKVINSRAAAFGEAPDVVAAELKGRDVRTFDSCGFLGDLCRFQSHKTVLVLVSFVVGRSSTGSTIRGSPWSTTGRE